MPDELRMALEALLRAATLVAAAQGDAPAENLDAVRTTVQSRPDSGEAQATLWSIIVGE